MTIGLSVSRKTVVNTKIDTSEEELKQAFNTAESGIDYYLGTGETKFVAPDSRSSADITVRNVGVGTTVNFNQLTLVNTTQQYWLVGHQADGSIDYATYYSGSGLNLCVDSGFAGALKIDYFYLDAALTYQVGRYGYNFSNGWVGGYTDLSPLPGTGSCASGYRQLTLTTPMGGGVVPLLLAVKPMGSGARMYLLGSGATFPIQGIELSSIGRVGDVSTGVNRKVNVMRLYQIPSFMLEAITTYGSVLSN